MEANINDNKILISKTIVLIHQKKILQKMQDLNLLKKYVIKEMPNILKDQQFLLNSHIRYHTKKQLLQMYLLKLFQL